MFADCFSDKTHLNLFWRSIPMLIIQEVIRTERSYLDKSPLLKHKIARMEWTYLTFDQVWFWRSKKTYFIFCLCSPPAWVVGRECQQACLDWLWGKSNEVQGMSTPGLISQDWPCWSPCGLDDSGNQWGTGSALGGIFFVFSVSTYFLGYFGFLGLDP